jgi:hypothetical protein
MNQDRKAMIDRDHELSVTKQSYGRQSNRRTGVHPGAGAVTLFGECLGSFAADGRIAEGLVRRAVRRAERAAEAGAQPTGLHGDIARIQDSADEQMELAARSRRMFVSNSAKTPSISRKHFPAALLVSTGCSVAFRATPRC